MLVVPNWPTQPWCTKLMQMITHYPRLLPVQNDILTHPSQRGSCHPLWQRLHLMACKLSGTVIQKQGVSTKAADIILKSWRPGTSKQYQPYIRNGIQYCHQSSIDPTNFTVEQALEFLLKLFEKGLGYSSLNTACCALSCIITPNNLGSFGSHPLVVRFLKGVYESRPTVPGYVETWDVTVVLKFLAN